MTKAEAKAEFDELCPPESFRSQRGYIDKPMRAEAWNNFTDALCKDRRITMKQYESWTHPWKD
jgi:folate-dependent tRNA-U54 methylase TrmFO/GidA